MKRGKRFSVLFVFLILIVTLLIMLDATTPVNVALNKPTTGRCDNSNYCEPSSHAVDGNYGTMWATGDWGSNVPWTVDDVVDAVHTTSVPFNQTFTTSGDHIIKLRVTYTY